MKAFMPKWVNPILNSIGVNSLRLGGLHINYDGNVRLYISCEQLNNQKSLLKTRLNYNFYSSLSLFFYCYYNLVAFFVWRKYIIKSKMYPKWPSCNHLAQISWRTLTLFSVGKSSFYAVDLLSLVNLHGRIAWQQERRKFRQIS